MPDLVTAPAGGFGIAVIGGYVPLLRLDRKAASRELGWSGLPMPRSGTRAVADWDEDALTMAVEAARPLCGQSAPKALRFASTSAYFTDRAQSGIALDALALPRTVRTSDAANSRRAATSALLDALLGGRDEVSTATPACRTIWSIAMPRASIHSRTPTKSASCAMWRCPKCWSR